MKLLLKIMKLKSIEDSQAMSKMQVFPIKKIRNFVEDFKI